MSTLMPNLILPGNPRYQPEALKEFFGYDHLYLAVAKVELAGIDVCADIGMIPADEMSVLTDELRNQIIAIPTTQVDQVERKVTKHDVRAWVRLAQELISVALRRWVHVPYTSYDPLATGRILQYLWAYTQAIRPAIIQVVVIMSDLVERNANVLQVGRTHGQHALPITVGFWLATILSRMLYNLEKMDTAVSELVGKISGAVGAYNAQVALGFTERCGPISFERRVLDKLGLRPARISTQVLPPEPLAYFLHACCMFSASLAQFGRDARHLMRSEIAEVMEVKEEGAVGSSTMGQKTNPINFENLEGMYLRTKNELGKVMDTLVSEHQRDLVGSSVERDFPIILVNIQQQLDTLLRQDKHGVPFLSRIVIDPKACRRNFELNAHLLLAEPLYIALQMVGYNGDAHKLITDQLTPIAKAKRISLVDALEEYCAEDSEEKRALDRIPEEMFALFQQPERYIGLAAEKAKEVAVLGRAAA